MDNELLLFDRINVIKETIDRYGEENFYIAFSGGKDSTILHYLIDLAIPGNLIPRVYINTGIEYNDIVDFVKQKALIDSRFEIIQPTKNIKQTLDTYGYPFKSKEHSKKVEQFYLYKKLTPYLKMYTDLDYNGKYDAQAKSKYKCPRILLYQFTEENKLYISANCCKKLKKDPSRIYAKKHNKQITITGMRAEEGGARTHIGCILKDKNGNIKKFNPLIKIDNDFEEWFIKTYDIKLCKLYYPPYNFQRTGCKGCPFSLNLENDLETLGRLLPNERAQAEYIFKPVYEEYRRLGYRLHKTEQTKLF